MYKNLVKFKNSSKKAKKKAETKKADKGNATTLESTQSLSLSESFTKRF